MTNARHRFPTVFHAMVPLAKLRQITVGTEPNPPETPNNKLFSPLEGRPPCRPGLFCIRLHGKVFLTVAPPTLPTTSYLLSTNY